jgi:hypothetical protein
MVPAGRSFPGRGSNGLFRVYFAGLGAPAGYWPDNEARAKSIGAASAGRSTDERVH